MIKYSEKLEQVLETRTDAASDCASGSCTAGYDNDGSTGREIFENGFELGVAAQEKGLDVFYGIAGDVAYFLMATDEEAACAEASTWDEDEKSED